MSDRRCQSVPVCAALGQHGGAGDLVACRSAIGRPPVNRHVVSRKPQAPDVAGKVLVDDPANATSLHHRNNPRHSWCVRYGWLDDRHRLAILLNDDLASEAHLFQYRVQVPGEFSLLM